VKLYHYTTASRLLGILHDRRIKPATAGIDKGERPVVWLSRAPNWEETANKSLMDGNTGERVLTHGIIEQAEHETPCRLEVDTEGLRLMDWFTFKRKSGVSNATAAHLFAAAVACTANPADWRACFEPIPLEKCCEVETWEAGKWYSFQDVMDCKRGLLVAGQGMVYHKGAK
jgi:hypothetical protein